MTPRVIAALAAVLLFSLLGCENRSGMNTLPTEQTLDIPRYLGTWYEIARYPARFQKGCVNSSAVYSLFDDGKIKVVNSCTGANGEGREATGTAWIPDPASPAKLKVRFFWPFTGDYWVVELGQDYEYSVVSEPNRKYLWILSRTPTMEEEKLKGILERLTRLGFDPERLIFNQ